MTVYDTEYGEIRRDEGCRDDYERIVTYEQPGGGVIVLQRAAMRSFQLSEERYGKKIWRPGMPKKRTQAIDREVWGKHRTGKRTFRPIFLTGSIRSCETQSRLHRSDPGRFASPNVGVHTHGLAIDVHTGWLNAMIRSILRNFDWKQSRPDDEPWHHSFHVKA